MIGSSPEKKRLRIAKLEMRSRLLLPKQSAAPFSELWHVRAELNIMNQKNSFRGWLPKHKWSSESLGKESNGEYRVVWVRERRNPLARRPSKTCPLSLRHLV